MRVIFVHRTVVDYTVETPYLRAVGGTEAGVSYLAAELAKLGHSVLHLASPSVPGVYRGVECLNHREALTAERLNTADVIVVVNEAAGSSFRAMGVRKPLVLWAHHADDQPPIEQLEFSRERKAWTAFAFVSQWQLEEFCRVYWLPQERARVMRNAIAPAFAELPAQLPWYLRGAPPVLVYTSAPYRGLDVLLMAYRSIREAVADVTLRVFTGLSTTRGGPEDNRYADLHARCLTTAGVEYAGPVSQPELAAALRDAAALAYPSTYPETSCIAALEAMALGATVITTRLGALPETLAGFGVMVDPDDRPEVLALAFAAAAITSLKNERLLPAAAMGRRTAQIAHVRENYQWANRAREWEQWLTGIAAIR